MTTDARRASRTRATKETTIEAELLLDGTGRTEVDRPALLRRHGGATREARRLRSHRARHGDLHVDADHTVEDVGIVLGVLRAEALGDKAGVRRFASMLLPLDEALMEVALDLSGRPYLAYSLEFAPDTPGLGTPPFDPQLAEEFWRAFATAGNLTLHIRRLEGKNTHHMLEASFKGVARRLRTPCASRGAASPHQGQPVTAGPRIAVLDYGIGNLRSAEKALQHVGAAARLVDDPRMSPWPTAWCCPASAPSGPVRGHCTTAGSNTRRPPSRGRCPLLRCVCRVPAPLRRLRREPGCGGPRDLPGVVGPLPGA